MVVFVLYIIIFLSGGDILNVEVNGMKFQVVVIYKRRNRRIYLRVKNGILVITTPTKLSEFSIQDMIQKNFSSILKVMSNEKKIEDEIHFLGTAYSFIKKASLQGNVYLTDTQMVVEYPSVALISKLVEQFYNKALEKIVEKYAADILLAFGLDPHKIVFQYKNVKGYYGECFPKRNLIILASKLAKYDLKYILSVIYHECAHFKYQNHQAAYYHYLEKIYPGYRAVQKELRKIKYQDAF